MKKANVQNRNLSIELVRFIAACFVIFLHVPFPGKFGKVVIALARFAVPFFFAISGYFAYNATDEKIKRSIIKILKLNLLASGLYMFAWLFNAQFINGQGAITYLKETITPLTIGRWVFLNRNPFYFHLWYLSAIMYDYLLFVIYRKFWSKSKKVNYKYWYIAGVICIFFKIFISVNARYTNISIAYRTDRDYLFFGLPMFALGLFINEYHDRIMDCYSINNKKAILFIVLGGALSIFQILALGKSELPLGTLILVFFLMLMLTSRPIGNAMPSAKDRIITVLGKSSLYIYIIHLLVSLVLPKLFSKFGVVIETRAGKSYVFPLIVLFASIVVSVIYTLIRSKINYVLALRKNDERLNDSA